MQAVPSEVRKSVVFLSFISKDNERVAGTAFFVNRPLEGTEMVSVYLVTARHVLAEVERNSDDGHIYIRLNSVGGGTTSVRSAISKWRFHPSDSSVDIAVLSWAPDPKLYDYLNVATDMAISDEIIQQYEIDAGDEVFIAGLFSNHYGVSKNLPILRVGNIALMPEEKVATATLGSIDAYLIEARSIGGLSGSPVFAYLGHTRFLKGDPSLETPQKLFVWLGVMHGHWDVDESAIDSSTVDVGGHYKSVNMGIGIVVPAEKVVETIELHESFIEERRLSVSDIE